MMSLLYRQTVTIRRPQAGSGLVDGAVTYKVVLDDEESPMRLRCRLERRARRLFTAQGAEVQTDATMLFIQKDATELFIDDVVVDQDSNAYKVVGLETQKALFGSRVSGRADLKATTDPVQHELEVEG